MRIFLVGWFNNLNQDIETEEVTIQEGEYANKKTFAKHIDNKLNHYNGYSCSEFDIKYWSLIEN